MKQRSHDKTAGNAHAENSNHGEVAVSVLVRALGSVLGPTRVQGVGRRDAPEVAEARDKGRRGGDSNLTVAALEDLVGPGHADRDGRAEAEADHQQAAVSGPGVGEGERDGEEACNLDADGGGEEEGAVTVEPVRNRGNEEDGAKVHLSRSASLQYLSIRKELTIQMGANSKLT